MRLPMNTTYPSLLARVQSTFIDLLVIIFLMYLCSVLLGNFDDVPNWIVIVLLVGIWGLYEPVCVALGCTIGNYIIKIRVRQEAKPGQRISLPASFLRYVLKTLLGWISFLTIGSNEQRRAIHDFAANSVVIRL